MSAIGFDDQVPSLPPGGGAITSLGSTFTPDLSTGTGSFSIPFDAPNGPNDLGPRLGLRYDTSGGNGPFGLGFTLPMPRIVLDTSAGYPHYDGTDALLLEGAGPLVALGGGAYRPQVDSGAWRAQPLGGGFRLTDRAGLYYDLGTTPGARVSDPANLAHVYAWQLETISDALGNTVQFSWQSDGPQRYLQSVSYGQYKLVFSYATRPDVTRTAQPGFALPLGLRCTSVELQLPGAAQPVLRRWELGYTQDPANAVSLLQSVLLTGFDATGGQLAAPPLTFGYSGFGLPRLVSLRGSDTALPTLARQPVSRVELVDWNGDGLPDVIEIGAGGRATVWANMGDQSLRGPSAAGSVPLFASPQAQVAFVDMDGDGFADLIRADGPLSGYVPRLDGAGFGIPVSWRQAPSAAPAAANTRLADLNGDGIVDLISSSPRGLSLFYRDADGWNMQPQVVLNGAGPDVSLDDPHVFLADMTGDGAPDIVRVDGQGVSYSPYLGNGHWDAPVLMATPPALPFNVRMDRVFVTDLDGDGCADILFIGDGSVTFWINQCGTGFGPPRVIGFVPTAAMTQPRLADMTGSGTSGLVWSQTGPSGTGTRYFYLEFVGETKPRLLTTIDNGIGLKTTISYTTSAREAGRAAASGTPWQTTLPVTLSVVAGATTVDAATGRTQQTQFQYRDGRYDGTLREFAGFGQVDQRDLGDTGIPTLLTSSFFHVGVDPDAPRAPLDDATRQRLRAIRGRLYRRDRYGEDGTAAESLPYDRLENSWDVLTQTTPSGQIQVPRLLSTTATQFERGTQPAAVVTTVNSAWDANQNITDSTQTAVVPGDPAQTRTLRTQSTFAADPAGRFLSLVSRVRQSDGTGTVIGDQVTVYDNAAEGTVGSQGLVTRRSALVLTDAMVAAAYGTATPDFAALHYYHRADGPGWWIDQAAYQRTDDAQGLRGTVTGPNGAAITFGYDASKCYPATMTDPAGNTITADYDYRVARAVTLVDAAGQPFQASFDALARLTARVEPGDTAALPTLSYEYESATLPVSLTQHTRAETGNPATVDERTLYDGNDTLIQRRVTDETGEVAAETHIYNTRGLLQTEYAAWRPPGPTFATPPSSVNHASLTYDAVGRPLSRTNPDAAVRTWQYGPRTVTETDERGNTTRKLSDATGRIVAIEQQLSGATIRSSNTFDAKGNLISHADAAGNVTHSWYDALGRVLRVQRPESDTATVYDAVGNAVEARTGTTNLVTRAYDSCNRLVSVSVPASANPVIRYTYHDATAPPPADAGVHTAGGRCVRIDDEAGSTVFDYDACGRAVLKRSTPTGALQAYDLTLAYRPDGQLQTITYPQGSTGQLTLQYSYGKRGLVTSVPGVVTAVGYDLDGRRSSVTYANGVQSTYDYDAVGHFAAIGHANGTGAFYSATLAWDGTGNLTSLASPDPALATTFSYDGLNRLTRAATGAGDIRTYSYDTVGNFTQKSDVGAYSYGQNGAPLTCLTSAGSATFTYSPLGQMEQTPWGTQSFDSLGRLISITGPITANFSYDYAGLRVSASFTKGGVTSTRITPDTLYAIEDGTLVRYLFDGARLVARDADGGDRTYLHEDHLSSIVALTDATASVTDTIRYDPFGAIVARKLAGSSTPIGFGGGELDLVSGLLYLQARYYHPTFGRFVSPDPIVQDVFDPSAWNAYSYCRNNPQSYIDPTGRSWWQILVGALAVVAIVALVVLSVVTFGATTPLLVVGIGLVAGGIVGGVAAAQAGGTTGDIVLGVLVGAAVGGWASFAAVCGAGAAGNALGINNTLLGAVTAGAVNGAINGAAIGFAAGFAGGRTTLDTILEKVAVGALVGAVVGGALGGLSYTWSNSPPPSESAGQQALKAMQPPAAAPSPANALPSNIPTAPPTEINNFGQALATTTQGTATKVLSPLAEAGARYMLTSPFATAATVLVVDSSAGVTDLGYAMQILYQIGVIKSPTIKWG
jgi:RHS repeat-associated protein